MMVGDFVSRSMAEIGGSLERAVYSEETARLPGYLQGIDSRAKGLALLMFLLVVGTTKQLAVVLFVYLVVMLLARLSGLPLLRLNRRVWLGIPLFSCIVALPSLFMLPGESILVILSWPPLRLAVTDNGLSSATMLVARVGTSVAVTLLLVSTTRWSELLRALTALRIPNGYVAVLGMTHRYLFLFLRTVNNLFLARQSRTLGTTPTSEQLRWTAGVTGSLVGRSVKLSGDVLMAMRARGFEGEIQGESLPRMRDEDWLVLAAAVTLAAGLLLLDLRLPS